MNKNGINADDSVDEPFKETYCKDVTSILTKNATDHSATIKVTEDLERQRLKVEHAEIDKKIAAIVKRIEKSQKECLDLDRQIYNATELKNFAMTRFQRTGEMINVLIDAVDKVKSQSKKTEIRRQEYAKKVDELVILKSNNETLKKQTENYEQKIRNLLDAPEPQPNQLLTEEHVALKIKSTEQLKSLNSKRIKKNKIEGLRAERLKVMQQIYEAQERNNRFRNEVGEKKDILRHKEQQMGVKFDEMQQRLNRDLEKRNILTEDYEKCIQKTTEMQNKIEKIKETVLEKERELQSLKEKVAFSRNNDKEENNKKKKEYEFEIEKLRIVEQKLQDNLVENNHYRTAITDKFENIAALNDKKVELMMQLCEQKNKLVIQQHQNTNQQSKIDVLSEKLETEMLHVNEMRAKKADLEAQIEEIKIKLEEIPAELNERRAKIMVNHKEKLDGLVKQQNFQKATIEFLQFRLDGDLKKIEQLQKKIQEYDDGIKWEEMKYEMRKKTSEKLREKTEKEQALYEKLMAQVKHGEDGKNKSIVEKKDLSIGSLRNKSPVKESECLSELVVIEAEDKTSQSGRKSPGILKSPYKTPKGHVPANKRVTFEGLSSTDSSSVSVKSAQAGGKNTADETIDDILRDWASTSYIFADRGTKNDF